MKQIKESNLNRILSHTKDKDIAVITAFRTDPELGLSKTRNRERNKKLESKLIGAGYSGFTKVVGYWNETPEDKNSVPSAEESYFVLNLGNRTYEDFVKDMIDFAKDVEGGTLDQQGIIVWNHEEQKAYLYDKRGNIESEFNNFTIDNITQIAWTQIKGHNFSFVEEAYENFSDTFNKGGNFMTAMGYDSFRNKLRKQAENINIQLNNSLSFKITDLSIQNKGTYSASRYKYHNMFKKSEGIAYEPDKTNKGGLITFSTEVNAYNFSDSKFKNWMKKKIATIDNRINTNKRIDEIGKRHDLVGWTVGHFLNGRYTSNNGLVFDEKSLSLEIIDVDLDTLIAVAEELCIMFLQESVLLKDYTSGRVMFIDAE